MAVSITSPQDSIQNRKSNITFTWTALAGQTAYEFQYKLITDSTWSTLGKTNSTNSSASLNLNALIDGTKYYYRFIIYYTKSDSVGVVYTGYEVSQAYTIVFTATRLGTLKIKTSAANTEEIPLYSETNKSGPKIKVRLSNNATAITTFDDGIPEMSGKLKTIVGDILIYTYGGQYAYSDYSVIKTSIRPTNQYNFAYSNIKPSGYIQSRYSEAYDTNGYKYDKTYSYSKSGNKYDRTYSYAYNYNYVSGYNTLYQLYYYTYDTGQYYQYIKGYYYDHTDTWYTSYQYISGHTQHSESYQKIHYTRVSYNYYEQVSPTYWYYGTAYQDHYAYTENGTRYWYTDDYSTGYTPHSSVVYGTTFDYAKKYNYAYSKAYYEPVYGTKNDKYTYGYYKYNYTYTDYNYYKYNYDYTAYKYKYSNYTYA